MFLSFHNSLHQLFILTSSIKFIMLSSVEPCVLFRPCSLKNWSQNLKNKLKKPICLSDDITSICRNDESSNRRTFGCFSETNDCWKAAYICGNRFRSVRLSAHGEAIHAPNNYKDFKHLGGFGNVEAIFESCKFAGHSIHLSETVTLTFGIRFYRYRNIAEIWMKKRFSTMRSI